MDKLKTIKHQQLLIDMLMANGEIKDRKRDKLASALLEINGIIGSNKEFEEIKKIIEKTL